MYVYKYVCMYVCMNEWYFIPLHFFLLSGNITNFISRLCTSMSSCKVRLPLYTDICTYILLNMYTYKRIFLYTYIYISHLHVKWAQIQIYFRIYIPVFIYVSNVSTVVWNGKPEMNTWKYFFSSALNIMYTYTYMYI